MLSAKRGSKAGPSRYLEALHARLPLADELPYQFYPPRIHPLWCRLGRLHIKRQLRRVLRVESIEIAGLEGLTPLLARGDGVLITPNHSDNADAGVMFELGHRLRRPFYFMAAYQLFTGLNRIHLPRLGVFPVDREGSDLRGVQDGRRDLVGPEEPARRLSRGGDLPHVRPPDPAPRGGGGAGCRGGSARARRAAASGSFPRRSSTGMKGATTSYPHSSA